MLSKFWENFMFWIISYLRKLNKYKGKFSDHILYPYHTNFYVYHRPNNQPNDMWKHLSLMSDSSKNNDCSTSYFIFSNLQWFSAFTIFPSTSEGVWRVHMPSLLSMFTHMSVLGPILSNSRQHRGGFPLYIFFICDFYPLKATTLTN